MTVDLFLGGDLGSWVLDQIDNHSVGAVVTCDANPMNQLKPGCKIVPFRHRSPSDGKVWRG